MILAIDVGNTNTVVGLFDSKSRQLVDHWRLATNQQRTADEWRLDISGLLGFCDINFNSIDCAVVCSVVPKVTTALAWMCERVDTELLVVDWQSKTGMPIELTDPSELGPDRIANAVAVIAQGTVPAIVVDLGTATTFDVVGPGGTYLGGMILPGVDTSMDALFAKAAALRRIDLSLPTPVVGTSTAGAIRSGASHGFAAQIDGICERIESEVGPCRVVATGGLSTTVAPFSKRIEVADQLLTLSGLLTIHERNSK
jgi:type III pantothenate kinase